MYFRTAFLLSPIPNREPTSSYNTVNRTDRPFSGSSSATQTHHITQSLLPSRLFLVRHFPHNLFIAISNRENSSPSSSVTDSYNSLALASRLSEPKRKGNKTKRSCEPSWRNLMMKNGMSSMESWSSLSERMAIVSCHKGTRKTRLLGCGLIRSRSCMPITQFDLIEKDFWTNLGSLGKFLEAQKTTRTGASNMKSWSSFKTKEWQLSGATRVRGRLLSWEVGC
jgi:hypothetical protein